MSSGPKLHKHYGVSVACLVAPDVQADAPYPLFQGMSATSRWIVERVSVVCVRHDDAVRVAVVVCTR